MAGDGPTSPVPRFVSKLQDVSKSGNGNVMSLVLKEDPMSAFNKQPRRWLHIDADGHVSYVTVGPEVALDLNILRV